MHTPIAGQNRDVNLRMTKEPEEMLPQKRRAALVSHELAVHDHQRNVESLFRGCDPATTECLPRAARQTPASQELP